MNTIQEAKRYIDNAREVLRDKAHKEDRHYQDGTSRWLDVRPKWVGSRLCGCGGDNARYFKRCTDSKYEILGITLSEFSTH